jgi:hypothetical protein
VQYHLGYTTSTVPYHVPIIYSRNKNERGRNEAVNKSDHGRRSGRGSFIGSLSVATPIESIG